MILQPRCLTVYLKVTDKSIFLLDIVEPVTCLEESLEEMKNVVRKKLGLSSSLSVHLSQLREGKLIVLEDGIRLNLLFDHMRLNRDTFL